MGIIYPKKPVFAVEFCGGRLAFSILVYINMPVMYSIPR
jgi:hypothetical protein